MTAVSNNVNLVGMSDVAQMGMASVGNLTADGLMFYLQSRLDSVDSQIDEIFEKQQKTEKIRSHISDINTEVAKLEWNDDGSLKSKGAIDEAEAAVKAKLENLAEVDPALAKSLTEEIFEKKGGLFESSKPTETQYDALKSLTGNVTKQLESSAQMDMIKLQSMMSARQSAVQLASNMVASLGETNKSVVSNIR